MSQKKRILVVDDEEPILDVLTASLDEEGYEVRSAANSDQALDILKVFRPHVVLLDVWMPGKLDGIETLETSRALFPETEFVIMSGHGTIETAVKATKLGAWDFIEKPLSMDKILIVLSNVLAFQEEKNQKNQLLNKLRKNFSIIGESQLMMSLKHLISKIANTNSWVLIRGENGTGKELVAHNIHYLSSRATKPFIEVNCAAIPNELIESELFGYEKGAFTGATQGKKGKFDLANGGTIFLDEIADMSLQAQAKILRILQEHTFQRVGGVENIKVDVRVLAATNKNLESEIKSGKFREDLYYRLNVIPITVPPLRDRTDDIDSLINYFSQYFANQGGFVLKHFSIEALQKLKNHKWPGNVRELKNFMERLYILTPTIDINIDDLKYAGLYMDSFDLLENGEFSNFKQARAKFEKEYILKKLDENNGNISRTAEIIGLERSHLHRKIKSYGIEV